MRTTANERTDRVAYSRREVASMTGQSEGKIDLDIRRKLLHARKCGARVLILAEDLKAYLRGSDGVA